MRKPVLCRMRTTKAQISLRILAFVISAFAVRPLDIIIPIDVISKITKSYKKSRERHNHKPQPTPKPRGREKWQKLTRTKQTNKCTRSTQTSFLLPKRGDHNTKMNEETRGQRARLELVSVAKQIGLSLTWSQTSEDRFSHDVSQILFLYIFPSSRSHW